MRKPDLILWLKKACVTSAELWTPSTKVLCKEHTKKVETNEWKPLQKTWGVCEVCAETQEGEAEANGDSG